MQRGRGNLSPSSQSDCSSSSAGTLIINTSPHLLSAVRKCVPAPPSPHTGQLSCIDLTGEEFISDSPDLARFPISPSSREELLRCETAPRLCVAFFKRLGLEMKPMVRTDGKRRFSRLEVERGEYVFEEGIDDSLHGRSVASLKAVRTFNPELVSAWLQKYRKVKEVLKGRLL